MRTVDSRIQTGSTGLLGQLAEHVPVFPHHLLGNFQLLGKCRVRGQLDPGRGLHDVEYIPFVHVQMFQDLFRKDQPGGVADRRELQAPHDESIAAG